MRRTGSAPRSFWPLAAIFLAFLTPAHAGTTEGEAWYRERIALPPEAVFEAVLLDVSRADAAGQELARSRLEPAGQPPFRFKIDYDDEAVRPGGRYAVRATVTLGGHPYFTTDRNYPAFDGDKPLRMLLVRARGSSEQAPRSDADPGPRSASSLRNTYWKLTRLGEAPVQVAEGQREPHLVLAADTARVSGSGGCNRFAASFTLKHNELRFSGVVSTRMACVSGMEQEQRFLATLATVARYSLSKDQLELLDASGAVLMQFTAVVLR